MNWLDQFLASLQNLLIVVFSLAPWWANCQGYLEYELA